MNRRSFIKCNLAGLAAVAMHSIEIPGSFTPKLALAAERRIYRLNMIQAIKEMVDLTTVPAWVYADENGPHFPGPIIFVTEGERVEFFVSNELNENHAFAIPGVVPARTLRPGQQRLFKFTAPPAGTYLYLDPLNAPINRVMGLHGVLVSMPRRGNSPYGSPTPAVQALFNDLGTTETFPGEPWKPERQTLWIYHSFDPALHEAVFGGEQITPDQFTQRYKARYWTINGKSGFWAAHAEDVMLSGCVGEPRVLRNINTGMEVHSPHPHANHLYVLAVDGEVQENVVLVDCWAIRPMQRIDLLFPFIMPPDIPPETVALWREGRLTEPMPMDYPAHCHREIPLTAGGGSYPQGLMAHIEFHGSRPGVPHTPHMPFPFSDDDEPSSAGTESNHQHE